MASACPVSLLSRTSVGITLRLEGMRPAQGPLYTVPVMQFVDENCLIFDDEEENKLEYTVARAQPSPCRAALWRDLHAQLSLGRACRSCVSRLQVHGKFKALVDNLLGGAPAANSSYCLE